MPARVNACCAQLEQLTGQLKLAVQGEAEAKRQLAAVTLQTIQLQHRLEEAEMIGKITPKEVPLCIVLYR